jgi:hypothetical protein
VLNAELGHMPGVEALDAGPAAASLSTSPRAAAPRRTCAPCPRADRR